MEAALPLVIIFGSIFGLPAMIAIAAIVTDHQRKMKLGKGGDIRELMKEVQSLRAEVAQLRNQLEGGVDEGVARRLAEMELEGVLPSTPPPVPRQMLRRG